MSSTSTNIRSGTFYCSLLQSFKKKNFSGARTISMSSTSINIGSGNNMDDPTPTTMGGPADSAFGHTTTWLVTFVKQMRKSIISTFNKFRDGIFTVTMHGRSNVEADPEQGADTAQDEESGAQQTGVVEISDKALKFASGITITASAAGIFGISQLSCKNTMGGTQNVIYIASKMSLLAAFVSSSVVVLIVSLTQKRSTLVLKSFIGVGIVLTMFGYILGSTFTLPIC